MQGSLASGTEHWQRAWQDRDPESVTWYQPELAVSRRFIDRVSTPTASVIDVGAGASMLVDHLLASGYIDVTVLDIADAALAASRARLGPRADEVRWIVADITQVDLDRTFDLWHDRAVFHFLVDDDDRQRYLAALRGALVAGGHLVLSTFGPDGPERCSGLPVRRYGIELMQETLGPDFELLDHELETHVAPSGVTQQFLAALFQRAA
jgi:SAM-dependent methyltransferase